MHAKIIAGSVAAYPFTQQDLQAQYPSASVPTTWTPEFMAAECLVQVVATGAPTHDPVTHCVVEAPPQFVPSRNRWEQQWQIRALPPEQVAANQAAHAQAVLDGIVQQTQQRLDEFARTRHYDGILSACTYATSTVPKFQAEGQYCVQQRDATWAALYQVLADAEAGTRPTPAGFADVEGDLPELAWPN